MNVTFLNLVFQQSKKMRKVSSGLEKEINYLRVESSGLNKAQGLKKGKSELRD